MELVDVERKRLGKRRDRVALRAVIVVMARARVWAIAGGLE